MINKSISIKEKKEFDLVGIGNAIVDILVNVKDDFLKNNNLKKGSMNLIDLERSKNLLNKCNSIKTTSGGSSANTVVCLSQLNNKVEFIGRIKDDYYGQIFSKDLNSTGVVFNTRIIKGGPPSAHSIIFVTPDAQRTMCTYLGASVEFEPENINLNSIKRSKYLYLEGYLWDSELAKQAFIEAAKTARESNTKIILSLSDSFCVERHRESFLSLISDYVDILFSNEAEIFSLLKLKNLENCTSKISNLCDLVIITLGEKGSLIINGNEKKLIAPKSFGQPIDTTGAGDIFASGFIHGLINDCSLNQCGDLGSICAGHIITQLGSRSSIDFKKLIKENSNL